MTLEQVEAFLATLGPGVPEDQIREACRKIALLGDELTTDRLAGELARKVKITKQTIRSIVHQELKKIEYEALKKREKLQRLVKNYVPDAPVTDDASVPPKFSINEDGSIVFEGQHIEYVSPIPIFVTKRIINIDEDTVKLELAYRRNGIWKYTVAPRSVVSDTKKIITLADEDVPVSSDNAKWMVKYFSDYEQRNLPVIPEEREISSMGWKDVDGHLVFVLGNDMLSAGGAPVARLILEPPGAGEYEALEAVAQGGTWEGWLDDVFAAAWEYPFVRFGIYVALASPLLTLVGAPGFVWHYCKPTTKGKSTALQTAASVLGYPGGPQLTARRGVISGWNRTEVAAERLFAFLRHVPAFLDDSHLAPAELVSRIVYAAVNGIGRHRGAVRGSQRVATWHLAVLSTGEKTMRETTQLAGVQVRAVDVWAEPFHGPDAARAAQRLRRAAGTHYGHAFPHMVRALAQLGRDEAARLYARAHEDLLLAIGGTPDDLSARLLGAFAAILTAAEVFHRRVLAGHPLGEVPYEKLLDDTVRVFRAAIDAHPPVHTHVAAYRTLMAHAEMNPHLFYGGDPSARPPASGWAGVWETTIRHRPGERFIAFDPHWLREFLQREGFPYESCLRAWQDEGWLVPDEANRRPDRLVNVEGTRKRLIVLVRPHEATVGDDAFEPF